MFQVSPIGFLEEFSDIGDLLLNSRRNLEYMPVIWNVPWLNKILDKNLFHRNVPQSRSHVAAFSMEQITNPRARVLIVEDLAMKALETIRIKHCIAHFKLVFTSNTHWSKSLVVGWDIKFLAVGPSEPASSILSI